MHRVADPSSKPERPTAETAGGVRRLAVGRSGSLIFLPPRVEMEEPRGRPGLSPSLAVADVVHDGFAQRSTGDGATRRAMGPRCELCDVPLEHEGCVSLDRDGSSYMCRACLATLKRNVVANRSMTAAEAVVQERSLLLDRLTRLASERRDAVDLGEWRCSHCRERNEATAMSCAICDTVRPLHVCETCGADALSVRFCLKGDEVVSRVATKPIVEHEALECRKCSLRFVLPTTDQGGASPVECPGCGGGVRWYCARCAATNWTDADWVCCRSCGNDHISRSTRPDEGRTGCGGARLSSLRLAEGRISALNDGIDVTEYLSEMARQETADLGWRRMVKRLDALQSRLVPAPNDGNCLFTSLAAQLPSLARGIAAIAAREHPQWNPTIASKAAAMAVRHVVCDEVASAIDLYAAFHPELLSTVPTVSSPPSSPRHRDLSGREGATTPLSAAQRYLTSMCLPGVWGDELCLSAFCRATNAQIHIITDARARWHHRVLPPPPAAVEAAGSS